MTKNGRAETVWVDHGFEGAASGDDVWLQDALIEREAVPPRLLQVGGYRALVSASAVCVNTTRGPAFLLLHETLKTLQTRAVAAGVPLGDSTATIAGALHRVALCNRMRSGSVRVIAGLPYPSWSDWSGRPVLIAAPWSAEAQASAAFAVHRGVVYRLAGGEPTIWPRVVRELALLAGTTLAPVAVREERMLRADEIFVCSADGISAVGGQPGPVTRAHQQVWRHALEGRTRSSVHWFEYVGLSVPV